MLAYNVKIIRKILVKNSLYELFLDLLLKLWNEIIFKDISCSICGINIRILKC